MLRYITDKNVTLGSERPWTVRNVRFTHEGDVYFTYIRTFIPLYPPFLSYK